MRVLGIETSCDETAVAVIEGDRSTSLRIVSNVVHTQVEAHAPFGGVVPEIASREHIARIGPLIARAVHEAGGWPGIDAVAVTRGPGLVGCLLVGLQAAKGLALARNLPWIGVNHLEGHLMAAHLADEVPAFPHVALLVSGGHTQLYHVSGPCAAVSLGGTRDDAAGEAFDKAAKLLGLGYPGGARIEREAVGGDPAAVSLPRAMPAKTSLELSFSGLKTRVAEVVRASSAPIEGQARRDLCASVQEAIVDVLTKKAVAAARAVQAPGVVLAGGVAANGHLRTVLQARCISAGLWCVAPPKPLCTDNAAMIAAAGWVHLNRGERSPWSLGPKARWPLPSAAP